jgi:hypothetical protein
MNKLIDLIQSFETVTDWQEFVNKNFERSAGTYSYATVSNIEVKYNHKILFYPTKIVFEYGYVKAQKSIIRIEKITLDKQVIKITERRKVIPFSYYERKGKYTGEIFQILNDIIGTCINKKGNFSPDLLSTHDSPLYNIDSKQKWASYLLVLQRQRKKEVPSLLDTIESFNDLLADYGIHYSYAPSLRDLILIVFPMPYLKVVENKIKKRETGESIFLVIEFNELVMVYTSQLKIEIQALIKDFKQQTILDKTVPVKFDKAKFQVVEITPEVKSEIGFSAFTILINGTLVDKFSGYYIRNIKIDIKAK